MALARARVAIGCVVRNRAWILPEYLTALKEIEYDNKEYLFLENDSSDNTMLLLTRFFIENQAIGEAQSFHTGAVHWDHGEYAIDHYANLAKVRNRFIDMFLETDADFLLSVDSDIIVPPDVITRLMNDMQDDKSIVAAAISNIPDKRLDGVTPGNFLVKNGNKIEHPLRYPLSGVHEMAVIGAVYLIPRQAFIDGVRYAPGGQGEDVGFCNKATELGYKLYVDTGIVCEHHMVRR